MSTISVPCHIPFVQSGSYPARGGNSLRLLVDGVAAFRRICESIEAAHCSVWVTVTFMWPEFTMPDGRGTVLSVLERAAARGLDVRVIFWRPEEGMRDHHFRNTFWGSAEHAKVLQTHAPHVKVRWDRARAGFCHHQKSWLIDAGENGATSFIGGINLNPNSLTQSGHHGDTQNHDAYVELTGPSTVDVHHNFVQRWNEASERSSIDGCWGAGCETLLRFPEQIPIASGKVVAQVQRTIHAAQYSDGHATPGGTAFNIALGEQTNFEQYCAAIDAARRSVYIENQYIDVGEIVEHLDTALQRGVAVVAVVPAEPDGAASSAARARLARHENFTLAGIAGLNGRGMRTPVYVHDKVMLVDDEWATVGSCNLHRYSLFGNSELNVAFADHATVRAMRAELFREHLHVDTSGQDDVSALGLFRKIADENRKRLDARDAAWQGLAFRLDAATYGFVPH